MRLRPWRRPALRASPLAPDEVLVQLLREALEREGEVVWRARGRSMRGAIADGHAVRLVCVDADRLVAGAVVMAELSDGRLVLHRVMSCQSGGVVLRGDASRRRDPTVAVDRIIAIADPTPTRSPLAVLHRIVP